MLNNIKLTNFRKHTNTDLPLHDGLLVLRGGNEKGKSTLLEGIGYALGGVKFLRSPLEDTVTYGEPVSSLKAELVLTIDGVVYSIKRGKSGAECVYGGGRVTGQTEVTNFIFGKLGVDPSAAGRLMFSNQNEIRGALEAGPKATAELIERLAEFDQIDKLIDLIQEKLTLGSTATAEAALAKAEADLHNLGALQLWDKITSDKFQASIDNAKAQEATAVAAAAEAEVSFTAAQAALDQERAKAATAAQVEGAYATGLARFKKSCDDLRAAAEERNVEQAMRSREMIQKDIDAVSDSARHLQAWGRLSKFVGASAVKGRPEGTLADLVDELINLTQQQDRAHDRLGDAKRHKAVAEAGLANGSCGFCGQDFSDVPAVAEKNAKTQAEIDRLTALIEALQQSLEGWRAEHLELARIQALAAPVFQAVESNPDYLKVEGEFLPPDIVWIGPKVEDLQNAAAQLVKLQTEMKELDAELARRAAAEARHAALTQQRDQAETELAALKVKVEVLLAHDVPAAEARRTAAADRRRPLQDAVASAQAATREAEYALRDAQREHERAVELRESLKAEVERREAEIKTTEFNNALLKRVRQARPAIGDKLWGIVLSAVSSYFSEMRGEKSRVTKDSDGFKVDDHPVATLSGSTLDILGLAIRVALVRTFLPNAPFLVLDEPCAAMDDQRTGATLGFIAACGFKQVICASHDALSESAADHLVEV